MSPCSVCSGDSLPTTYPKRVDPNECFTGDICSIYASLSTPIELMLQRSPVISEDPNALRRSEFALSEVKRRNIGKDRPRILVRGATSGIQGARVYLMGTVERKPVNSLCVVLRQFMKPIFPNRGPRGSNHFHTTPQWPHGYQWVVGYLVELDNTEAQGLKRWHSKAGATYMMDEDTLDTLVDDCDDTFTAWEIRCRDDPAFAMQSESQWRVSAIEIESPTGPLLTTGRVWLEPRGDA